MMAIPAFPSPKLPRTFLEDLYACGIPQPDCHLLAAFSGGADSTALLDMLFHLSQTLKKPFRLAAIHIHHGIRGSEADRDAAFCRDFCSARDIPFFLYTCDVPALARESGRSLEEEAREQRYALIAQHIDSDAGITHLLTAHHADDQAETILFRMLRGTAVNGLSGIPLSRPFITAKRTLPLVRPFLRLSKADILAYCKQAGLSYVQDSTNFDTDCTRNLLRTIILPAVNTINPAFSSALLRLSEEAATDTDYLEQQAKRFLDDHADLHTADEIILPLSKTTSLHPAIQGRVLAGLYHMQKAITTPITNVHIQSMRAVLTAEKPASISLPQGFSFFTEPDSDRCYIAEKRLLPLDQKGVLLLPCGIAVTIWNRCLCFFDDGSPENEKKLRDLKIVYKFFISTQINSDKLLGSIFIRKRKTDETDRYLCGTHERSAREALSAHKVPRGRRQDIPLYCDDQGIVWIPFCGIRDSVNPRFSQTPPSHTAVLYYFYNDDG